LSEAARQDSECEFDMRIATATFALCWVSLLSFASDQKAWKDFPLTLEVSESKVEDLSGNVAQKIKSEQLGLAPDIFVRLTATINGKSHWWIKCRRENPSMEANPCTELEAGKYPARWVHNGELLQVAVSNEHGEILSLFFDIIPKQKDPPNPDDPIFRFPRYDFPFPVPENRRLQDYPMLVHVYGAVSLRLPAGLSPRKVVAHPLRIPGTPRSLTALAPAERNLPKAT